MGTMEALTLIAEQMDAVAWALLVLGVALMALTTALRARDFPVLIRGFGPVTAFVVIVALFALLAPFLSTHAGAGAAWIAAAIYAAGYLLVLKVASVIARTAAAKPAR